MGKSWKSVTLATMAACAASATGAAASPGEYGDAGGMVCPGTCHYKFTVDMQWNARNHPMDYPAGVAQFSPFYSLFHDLSFILFRRGELADPAIQQIAELGEGDEFHAAVEECGDSCEEPLVLECETDSPPLGTCVGTGTLTATAENPYFSAASMLQPSPDWFTGVDTWNLCDRSTGEWIHSIDRNVPAYDSGTDQGPAFMSENQPNMTPAPIYSFGAIMPPEASLFYNPNEGEILPLGNFRLELVGCD